MPRKPPQFANVLHGTFALVIAILAAAIAQTPAFAQSIPGCTNSGGSTAATGSLAATFLGNPVTTIALTHGQPVAMTAAFSPSGKTNLLPTGSVDLLSSLFPALAFDETPFSAGTATFTVTDLPGGSYTLTGAYLGDANFACGTFASIPAVISPENPAFTLTSSVPAGTSAVAGVPLTLTLAVCGVSGVCETAGTQGGTASFTDAVNAGPAVALGTPVPVGATNTGIANVMLAGAGTHVISASFSGDASITAGATSASQALTITAVKASSATALQPLGATTIVAGSAVSFNANVTVAVGAKPTGTVTFFDGATPLGSAVSVVNGAASFATSSLAVGAHSITAHYSGDANDAASISAPLALSITAAPKIDFQATIPASSVTLGAGQQASIPLTLTSLNGYNAAVSLACTGLPARSTCAFTPASVVPTASGATATLVLKTSGPNTGTVVVSAVTRAAIPAALLALVLGPLLRRRRAMNVLAALIVFPLLAACGGGGTMRGPDVIPLAPSLFPTPSGTSTFSVVATGADGTTHTLAVTLTVTN
jgi:hypothetical protein